MLGCHRALGDHHRLRRNGQVGKLLCQAKLGQICLGADCDHMNSLFVYHFILTLQKCYHPPSRQPLAEAGRECEFFTMMRHPMDRLISAFFYCPYDHDIQERPDKVLTIALQRRGVLVSGAKSECRIGPAQLMWRPWSETILFSLTCSESSSYVQAVDGRLEPKSSEQAT